MVIAEEISKVYRGRRGEVRALDGVSVQAERGTITAVVGPSGSGKSTLLFALGTLARPTAGRVTIDGVSVYDLSPAGRIALRREKIGFVFQTFHLVPYLTAEENVRAALALRGRRAGEARTEARRVLERVGLADRLDHLPDDLSVGEQQRVALARAMAGGPKALLADEPTGNLDPASAALVCDHLRAARTDGAAVVIVTHDAAVAQMADRVLRLEQGRVLIA